MGICLRLAELKDALVIHEMKKEAFMPLLEKYEDADTNPANEQLEQVIEQINQDFIDYYVIEADGVSVGGIRIVKKDNQRYLVSPLFILPEHQGKGIAQEAFKILETTYEDAKVWELDTLLQEQGNCYLYEKIGYEKTGKTFIINSKLTIVSYEKVI